MNLNKKNTSVKSLDPEIFWMYTYRSWFALSGLLSILMITAFLTPIEQGVVFTMLSLIGAQTLFELGLSQAIVPIISKEHTLINQETQKHSKRIQKILRMITLWYIVCAIMFTLFLIPVGIFIFYQEEGISFSIWLYPWCLLVLSSSINLSLISKYSFFEGIGQILGVTKIRTIQSIIGFNLMFLVLLFDGGIWALCAIPLSANLCTFFWLFYNPVPKIYARGKSLQNLESSINWKDDILPLQWRFGISWLSGYASTHLLVPITFATIGAISAGKIGITIATLNAILLISLSPITAKYPKMAALIAQNRRNDLNRLFKLLLKQGFLIILFCITIYLLFILFGDLFALIPRDRFASLESSLLYSISTVSTFFIGCFAPYMRAHSQEPMLKVSVVGMLLILTCYSINFGQMPNILLRYHLLITSILVLPWTFFMFIKYYRQ